MCVVIQFKCCHIWGNQNRINTTYLTKYKSKMFIYSALGIDVVVTDLNTIDFSKKDSCGTLFQYPDTEGAVDDCRDLIEKCHNGGVSISI